MKVGDPVRVLSYRCWSPSFKVGSIGVITQIMGPGCIYNMIVKSNDGSVMAFAEEELEVIPKPDSKVLVEIVLNSGEKVQHRMTREDWEDLASRKGTNWEFRRPDLYVNTKSISLMRLVKD